MRGRRTWLIATLALTLPALCLLPATAGSGKKKVAPINLEKLNTEADETDPCATAAGLLYASNTGGKFALYQARRSGKDWGAGKKFLGGKTADYRSPFLHKGTLYYACNEVPDPKLADLRNFDIFSRLGERMPTPVLGISERADEMYPWVTPAGKEFYFSRKTDEGWVLFVASGPSPGPIGKARPVGFEPGFYRATLTASALTMYLQGPLEGGRTGIFRSKRARVGAKWSAPQPITALDHPEAKKGCLAPCLTSDGARLYFASDRPGGKGGLDLWSVPTSALK